MRQKIFILFAFLFIIFQKSNATHIIGGELIYDCLGGNNDSVTYKITIKVYRDCWSGVPPFDNPLYMSIWNADGSFHDTIAIPLPGFVNLPFVSNDPCFTPPTTGVCVEEAIYIDTITIPYSAMGYIFAYQRCCRNNTILNLFDPGNVGATYTERVPSSDSCNSSPRYNNLPPIALCLNSPLTFDHSATDPDGDSLVYYICNALVGADPGDAQPFITSPPPFTPVTYLAPYTALNPIDGLPPLAIDPVTGELTITPTQLGQYVIAICCDEYRNGVLIGTHSREFQFNVVMCDPSPPVELGFGTIDPDGNVLSDSLFTEGCEMGIFTFLRTDTSRADSLSFLLTGTATEGADYLDIPSTLIIPQGVFSDTVFIVALSDALVEPVETLNLNIIYYNPCGFSYDTVVKPLYIEDYQPMNATLLGDKVGCGDTVLLEPVITGGFGNYQYLWYPTQDTTDSIVASTSQTQVYYVTIEDDCGKSIQSPAVTLVKQCPIIIPNIITANGDGVNDVFFIQNITDYPENEVWFYNRWGVLLHYAYNYQNDWAPNVTEGVYYYVVDNKVDNPYKNFWTVFK